MVRLSIVMMIVATSLTCMANATHAGFDYRLEAAATSTPGAIAQTNFTTNGGPLNLNLFLVQRDTAGAPTPPGFTLQTANFNIANVGTMTVTGATATFGSATVGSPTTYTNFSLFGSASNGALDPNYLQIGTLSVSGAIGSSSVFSFLDDNPALGNSGITLTDGTVIDTAFPSPYTSFSVTAVPEPSSMGILALAGVGLLRRRRR